MDTRVNVDPDRPGRKKPRDLDHTAPVCQVCGGFRPPLAVAAGDPFCSTECCRVAHGCELEPTTYAAPGSAIPEHSSRGYYRGCRCETCTAAATEQRGRRRREQAARARAEQVAA